MNRRNFIKAAGLGVAVAATPAFAKASVSMGEGKNYGKFNFDFGVASYTLRKFTTEEAIDMSLRCGAKRMTLKSIHLSPCECAQPRLVLPLEMRPS